VRTRTNTNLVAFVRVFVTFVVVVEESL